MDESVPTLTIGDGETGVVTACGELRLGMTGQPDLFTSLGTPMVVRFDENQGLQNQFIMLLAESARPGIGSRTLIEALLKQCLILALRRWIAPGTSTLPLLPWLTGVADKRLGRALQAIFERPATPFTVEVLADMAGMSRSAFAAAFHRAFGQSPMSLVKLVRLRKANELLIGTALPVAEIAKRVGFSSRSNFSLAFSQLYGTDPSRFRRQFTMPTKS